MSGEPEKRAKPTRLSNKALGDSGERIAAAHLTRLGWRVLATRFRCASGEIDVIAEEPAPEGRVIVFVEVKTRRGAAHGTPVEAVSARKQARIVAVAETYLAQHHSDESDPACRFDIAEVFVGPDGLAQVKLLRAAFGAI